MTISRNKKILLAAATVIACAGGAGLTWQLMRAAPECVARGALNAPKFLVDSSQNGFRVEGWAADGNGVQRVEIWAGGKLLASSKPGIVRSDVAASLAQCKFPVASGFAETLALGQVPPQASSLEVRAVSETGKMFPVGQVRLDLSKPFGTLDITEPIQADGRNLVSGWAIAAQGPVKVRVLALGHEVMALATGNQRGDVAQAFPAWPQAANSGFEGVLSMRALPRGRYPLRLLFDDGKGHRGEIAGPEVINDLPYGKVLAQQDKISGSGDIALRAWLADEDGIRLAQAETESGVKLGNLILDRENQPLAAFADPRFKAESYATTQNSGSLPLIGALYHLNVPRALVPSDLQRIQVRVEDKAGKVAILPGPLVLDQQSAPNQKCAGEKLRVFYPGGVSDFRRQFPQMQQLRAIAQGACVEIGFRGRVEYLRTTKGKQADYLFDPNFPERLRNRDGKEMTGDSLAELLDTARRLHAPLAITLDGGVWADAKFAAPDLDVVDMLESDETAVQWNQFGKSEPDDALKNLPGATSSPELARMMSLNRYNRRFMDYKKRNLQAAVREIVKFNQAHPDQAVMVNFDPDEYINPWFYLTQWYDYNPDTLRQYREWLFNLGPYASGGELAYARHEPALTLAEANRLANQSWKEIKDVDPPRNTIDYSDPWQQLWTQFKRHLVAQHYDDLAAWAVEAGLPANRIYTSQTFIQTDVAVSVTDPATGWTDQAGVSIEGAKPRQGHIGAILYGPASRNQGKPRSGLSLIDNIRSTDAQWGAVEFHPGTIAFPEKLASHAESYATMQAMINGGAQFLSPMWGSYAGDREIHPNNFKAYDAMEGSAFEFQLVWWLRAMNARPAGSLYFPFGNALVSSTDGWSAIAGTQIDSGRGNLTLSGDSARLGMISPKWEGRSLTAPIEVAINGIWPRQIPVSAELTLENGRNLSCLLQPDGQNKARCVFPAANGQKMTRLTLQWQLAAIQQKEKMLVKGVSLQFATQRR